jgi:hypothetical protein
LLLLLLCLLLLLLLLHLVLQAQLTKQLQSVSYQKQWYQLLQRASS